MNLSRPLGLIVLLGSLALSTSAQAQMTTTEAIEHLQSEDREALEAALRQLTDDPHRRAVTPLAERIRRGLPGTLALKAIEALVATERREAGAVLMELISHRRSEIRLAALNGMLTLRIPNAEQIFRTALSDSNAQVRGGAAIGLGQVGSRTSLPTLFVALDRGILEAATSIGQLADDEAVDRFVAYVGRLPLDALTPGLSELLSRDDVSNEKKRTVITAISQLATEEASTYLSTMIEVLPPGETRDAAQNAVTNMVSGQ